MSDFRYLGPLATGITAIDAMLHMIEMGLELIIEFMSKLGKRHYKALSRIDANVFDLRLVKIDPFLVNFKSAKIYN